MTIESQREMDVVYPSKRRSIISKHWGHFLTETVSWILSKDTDKSHSACAPNAPKNDAIHWALKSFYLFWTVSAPSTAVLDTWLKVGCNTLWKCPSLHWIQTELIYLFYFNLRHLNTGEATPIIKMLKNLKELGLSVPLILMLISSSESCSSLDMLTWFIWAPWFKEAECCFLKVKLTPFSLSKSYWNLFDDNEWFKPHFYISSFKLRPMKKSQSCQIF